MVRQMANIQLFITKEELCKSLNAEEVVLGDYGIFIRRPEQLYNSRISFEILKIAITEACLDTLHTEVGIELQLLKDHAELLWAINQDDWIDQIHLLGLELVFNEMVKDYERQIDWPLNS